MKNITTIEAYPVQRTFTQPEYVQRLIYEIESRICRLEDLDIQAFQEWRTYLEDTTNGLTELNKKIQGAKCNMLA